MAATRLITLSSIVAAVFGFVDYGNVYPSTYSLGSKYDLDASIPYKNNSIILSSSSPVLTLDFGTEVAGFPFFDVTALSGPTQLEVKYAEQFVALANPFSDGPWTFIPGLSNSFRVETFNITEVGYTESFFIQGGQRWEIVRLLTNTTITLGSVGQRSSSAHVPTQDTPGKFSTSNDVYNKIWDLGARVVQVACVDAGNAVSTWQVTPDGVLLRGQQTSQYVKGIGFGNYSLSFSTKISRGGTGWRVGSAIFPYGASFILTSEYPSGDTFLDTNRTLVPANTLVFNYGWWIVNQTTLATGWNQYFPISTTVQEDRWYNVSTTITSSGYNVTLDGVPIAFVPIAEALLLEASYFGSGSATDGTFGFGPWQDQIAYVKDVTVVAANGSLLYSDSMMSEDVLAEYNQADLEASVCMDGAKRDRLIWTGDFYHTSKIIPASTLRNDYLLGTIRYVFEWQETQGPFAGFIPIDAPLGARPEYKDYFNGLYDGLIDYQDLFLAAIGNYYFASGDSAGLAGNWEQIKALVSARLAYIDPVSGLMAGKQASYFLGPVNGSAVTALSAYALRGLVPLAEAYGDSEASSLYTATADNLSAAINRELWNPELGVYSLSLDAPSNFSLTGIAFTILSGTANSSQAASMVAKMPELRLGCGYKTSSGDVDSATYELSPNTQGFLLEALFKAHRDLGVQNLTVAKSLLDDFWSKMVTQNEYYSGASWEYIYPDGAPGIDLFTSLAHPWGAAPTYVLPEYVLGIRPTSAGFKTWEFAPLLQGLGLTEANGTVVTPYGDIVANWIILEGGNSACVSVTVPEGTAGTLVLAEGAEGECEGKRYRGGHVPLRGGKKQTVHVRGW